MNKLLLLLLSFSQVMFLIAEGNDYGPAQYAALPDWENPYVTQINRLPARSSLIPFSSAKEALKFADMNLVREDSPFIQSLDGAWKFSWAKQPDERVSDFWRSDYDVTSWKTITVPGCWQLQGEYDPPIYCNQSYPHVRKPPYIMAEPPHHFTAYQFRNPVGSYRRTFTVPASWGRRRVILHFDGVASAMYVWINGKKIGYSEDSRLPAEFDITDALTQGDNSIAVEVYRWCDGSYLECQDFWRLSGIFRSVWLCAERAEGLYDFVAVTTFADSYATGHLSVKPKITGNATVSMSLYDGDDLDDKIGDLDANGKIAVPKVKAWTAETPHLYTLLFTLTGGDEKPEYIARTIGFREVTIAHAQLKVNGRRVLIKGVNRHEMEPGKGYTQSREDLLRDIQELKKLNMNAVRTCHYPNATEWYALCDKFGIYLVDEANVESHGMGYGSESLAHRSDYLAQHVERNLNMVMRDRNTPSVIVWSMGNEAGFGENFKATYRAVKALDPTRPIQYERADAQGGADYSDILCPMYAWPGFGEQWGKSNPKKPLILCEYSHAMGNSSGGFQKYWDNVRKYPSVQGGFIWDYRDQALWKRSPKRKAEFLAYGGDYGDQPNDNNFCCNGLLAADHQWHPSAYEVRKVQQNIRVTDLDWKQGVVKITNEFTFRDLQDIEGTWELLGPQGQIAWGDLDDDAFEKLLPGQSATVRLKDWDVAKTQRNGEHFVTVRLLEEPDPVERAVVIADEQFAQGPVQEMGIMTPRMAVQWETVDGAGTVSVQSGSTRATFDVARGLLSQLTLAGKEVIVSPVTPNFWRAPNDNDRGNGFVTRHGIWRDAGTKAICKSFLAECDANGIVTVSTEFAIPAKESTGKLVYTFGNDSLITADFTFTAAAGLPTVPRVGLTFQVPKTLNDVTWFGRGPHENYQDRKESAYVGNYTSLVRDSESPDEALNASHYVKNQECGYRTDVRKLTLTGEGATLAIVGRLLFGFNVWPWTQADLENIAHPYELTERDLNTVNIDAIQMGVGGVDSWGAQPFGEHQPPSGTTYHLRFILSPR
ncbi:MAG: glycoside hydrolase family 2 TIM barrel-domain containing protein [Kiritimatiellia bacterium]